MCGCAGCGCGLEDSLLSDLAFIKPDSDLAQGAGRFQRARVCDHDTRVEPGFFGMARRLAQKKVIACSQGHCR